MKIVQTASRLMTHAALVFFACEAVHAQTSYDEQKKELELEQLELNKQKTMLEIIKGSAQTTAGNATLQTFDQSAEGLMLSRHVQERTARTIVSNLGKPDDRVVSVVFGEQPASTAEYLAVVRGFAALRENLKNANTMARQVFGEPEVLITRPVRRPTGPRNYSTQFIGPAAIPLALTAVTTIASILRVNTTVTGAALATPNEQFKAVLLQELERYRWKIDEPRTFVAKTEVADALFEGVKDPRDEAAKYYLKYLARVTKAKDGKAANLPDAEIIVGKALETALNDHAALAKALYTPANGVLPATVIEEQARLIDGNGLTRRILYINHHKAALTSITRQGTFTGIFGVPAHVSASYVVEYALTYPTKPEIGSFDTFRYDTPVMRITEVRSFLAKEKLAQDEADKKALAQMQAGLPTGSSPPTGY